MAIWDDVLDFGSQIFREWNKGRTADRYRDAISQAEDQNYQDYLNQYNYWKDYTNQAYGISSANAAAAQQAAAARAAAARQEYANQQGALRKAMRRSNKGYNTALGMTKPFQDVAMQLLPQMSNLYQSGLGNAQNAINSVFGASSMANLAPAQPAWNQNVPLPDYLNWR